MNDVPQGELPVDEFRGTERFRIRRRLGSGGMGVVYLAFDRQRNELVAVKTLRHVAPDAIYRLKREFRTNSELSHPQLVKLHELFCVDQQWFFTMEYVAGRNLLEYLAGEQSPKWSSDGADNRSSDHLAETNVADTSNDSWNEDDALPPPPTAATSSDSWPVSGRATVTPARICAIRRVLAELAAGVNQLHATGTLHRDLKPTNVLVADDSRVVILDFGLATQLVHDARSSTTTGLLVGTVPYMSPEQAKGKELTAASDWYSIGAILYEALTGRTPFVGRPLQMLTDKQLLDPPSPSTIVSGVPDDLDTLCMELLSRDANRRPTGEEVIRRLGVVPLRKSLPHSVTVLPDETPFVGRRPQLEILSQALSDVEQGETVVVSVQGVSGLGKTALIGHFLAWAQANRDSVVLAGRCHERESVPYKALDSLIDAFSHFLLTRSEQELEALTPRDTEPLLRLFPVLKRVEGLHPVRMRGREPLDKQEIRERALSGLREMLGRLSDRCTLILHIDDLQWSDSDSVALLHDLLLPPNPPALLLLTCHRAPLAAAASAFESLRAATDSPNESPSIRILELEPLDIEDSRQLIRALWDSPAPANDSHVELIASSAEGNPYFLETLVRHHGQVETGESMALEQVIADQVLTLDSSARRLLQLVSIAGCPLRYLDARRAAGLGPEASEALESLRDAKLIRTPETCEAMHVETYHDRIRETVIAQLSAAECSQLHHRLAVALESSGQTEPAALAEHFVAADQVEKGRSYYLKAAEDASDALAFDRAAELYHQASSLGYTDKSQQQHLRRKRAMALANAGRGAEAARQYELVAEQAAVSESLEWRRHAAMQYLFAGEIEQGLVVLRQVLHEQGFRLPAGPRHAATQWPWLRLRLRARGLRFQRTEEQYVPPQLLQRIDTCWAATAGLSIIDPISSAVFQTRGLLLALRSGEPYRVARSLCVEAAHVASRGGSKRAQVESLLDQAETIAARLDDPHVHGLIRLAAGMAALSQGRWSAARQCCDEADTIFREQCTGVAWELDCAAAGAATALYDAGEIAELGRRLPALRERARRRGNLFALTAPSSMNLPSLAADRPDVAQQILDDCMQHWAGPKFYVQHFSALYDQIQTDLYRGDPGTAWTRIQDHQDTVVDSLLMRVQLSRAFTHQTRARCALALAQTVDDNRPLLRLAEKDARRVLRERQHWTKPLAELLLAAIAAMRDQIGPAIELLEQSIVHFDKADMVLYAAVARRQLGIIRGGRSGDELVATARHWLSTQGVVDPDRLCRVYAPGFPDEVIDGNAPRRR